MTIIDPFGQCVTMEISTTPFIQCGAPKIAKLVQITPINIWFMVLITIVNGVYKPTYNWGAPHCRYII
jgi:hypothetical protein